MVQVHLEAGLDLSCEIGHRPRHDQDLREHVELQVKGSRSLMFLGKAEMIKFLIWMQFGGMTSQEL